MSHSRRRSTIVVYALMIGVSFALTLGLGAIWVYLSLVPVALLGAILFLIGLGHWEAKRRGDRRLGFAVPLIGIPFLGSLVGMIVALVRAF